MKGKIMTKIEEINELYKKHGDDLKAKYACIDQFKKTYGIPTEEIARYLELEADCITSWENYWASLSEPWWKTLWYKMTTRKKY
jgi:hypothetical protein